jgi:hypothetical protein
MNADVFGCVVKHLIYYLVRFLSLMSSVFELCILTACLPFDDLCVVKHLIYSLVWFLSLMFSMFELCILTACMPFDNLCVVMPSQFAWYLTAMIVSIYMSLNDHLF